MSEVASIDELYAICEEIASESLRWSIRVVVAESCTAGLVGSMLGRVPGASEWFCGSAVVYRNQTKSDWLGISPPLLNDPAIGPVSTQVAAAMCEELVRSTSEANFAISVTGHLGPQAPEGLDGVIFVGTCWRESRANVHRHQLQQPEPVGDAAAARRHARQQEATSIVLQTILKSLRSSPN